MRQTSTTTPVRELVANLPATVEGLWAAVAMTQEAALRRVVQGPENLEPPDPGMAQRDPREQALIEVGMLCTDASAHLREARASLSTGPATGTSGSMGSSLAGVPTSTSDVRDLIEACLTTAGGILSDRRVDLSLGDVLGIARAVGCLSDARRMCGVAAA